MKNCRFVIFIIVFLTFVSDYGLSLAADKGQSNSSLPNPTSNKNSHEEFHSKIDSVALIHPHNSSINVVNLHPKDSSFNTSVPQKLDGKMVTKPEVLVSSTSIATLTPKHDKVIMSEGGVEVSSQYPVNNKVNETYTKNTSINIVTTHPSNTSKIVGPSVSLTTPGFNITKVNKRIHGRPGVSEIVTPSTTTIKPSSSTTTKRPKKKKPLFTMITGDKETKDSESFIESSTTGRDYVLPIVLIILSLPIVGYLIKIIYRRGTEFTERQQYHRMYLIDGMYNSR